MATNTDKLVMHWQFCQVILTNWCGEVVNKNWLSVIGKAIRLNQSREQLELLWWDVELEWKDLKMWRISMFKHQLISLRVQITMQRWTGGLIRLDTVARHIFDVLSLPNLRPQSSTQLRLLKNVFITLQWIKEHFGFFSHYLITWLKLNKCTSQLFRWCCLVYFELSDANFVLL